MTGSTRQLVAAVPQVGRLDDILTRRAKHGEVVRGERAEVPGGLGFGRRPSGRPSPAGPTLEASAQPHPRRTPPGDRLLGRDTLDAVELRRDLVVAGINLRSQRDRVFRIGPVVFEGPGPCHPGSRMESALGIGGFQALRGHAGITARVIAGGSVMVEDRVEVLVN